MTNKVKIGLIIIAIIGISMLSYARITIYQCKYLSAEESSDPDSPCFHPDVFCSVNCEKYNDTYTGYRDTNKCHCDNGAYLFIEDVGFVYIPGVLPGNTTVTYIKKP